MAVVFYCECGRKYLAEDSQVGDQFRCPCGAIRVVPLRSAKPREPESRADLTFRVPSKRARPIRIALVAAGWLSVAWSIGGMFIGRPELWWASLVSLPILAVALWTTREGRKPLPQGEFDAIPPGISDSRTVSRGLVFPGPAAISPPPEADPPSRVEG